MNAIKKKVQPFLYAISESTLTFSHLMELLRQEQHFINFVRSIEQIIQFRNEDEFKIFILYLQRIWMFAPRKELGNRCIAEVVEERPAGPIERKLLKEVFDYIYEKMNPENFLNFKIARKEVLELQKNWMNTKRKDLKGLTPKQAILEERKILGNPSKKIDVSFNLYRP